MSFKRFGLKFAEDLSITVWDTLNNKPIGDGKGGKVEFLPYEHRAADRVAHEMNKRVGA